MPRWERLVEAFQLACELHGQQRRKTTGASYLGHLLTVAGTVIDHGGDEDEAVAALLHDAIEDQGGERARLEIEARFGDRVAAIVDGCSDTDQAEKPPWRHRKEEHLAHLAQAPPEVCRVMAADKLHNARALVRDYREQGEALWDHFHGGRDGTLWYFRQASEVLARREANPLSRELARAVQELEQLVDKAGGDDASRDEPA